VSRYEIETLWTINDVWDANIVEDAVLEAEEIAATSPGR